MTADFGILLPLWSYAADGGALLERVAGDVGIDHLTVPVVSGPHSQFRLAGATDRPYFGTEGGWHFPAEAKAYSGAGLRPSKARWVTGGDPLAQACQRAEKLGLRVVLRIDLRGVDELVEREPLVAQCNAWGQPVPAAGPCVCNPHLRELLRATFDDLRRYEPAGFELADWFPDSAADRQAARPLSWHAEARRLLDICFCPACRQVGERAGADPDQAARAVRVLVERHLAATDARREGEPPGDPLVAAYVAARTADCREWLRRLAAADDQRQHLLVYESAEAPPYGDGPPWPRLLRLGGDAAESGAEYLTALPAIAVQACGLAMGVWRPAFAMPADLVRFVLAATQCGLSVFDFEGLDDAPPDAVTWLKQAVRFARRG